MSKNWCFWTVCSRRLLRVRWTARRSNQSILKEINPEYSLEGLMLKLKLQYFGHLMQSADSLKRPWCWERLRAGGEGDDRGWDGWMLSPAQWTEIWINSRSWWWTWRPGILQSMGSHQTWLSGWTELNETEKKNVIDLNKIIPNWNNAFFPLKMKWRYFSSWDWKNWGLVSPIHF